MPSSNPFGVLDFLAWNHDWNGHHYPLNKVREAAHLMKEAGVGSVRMDFLWSDIEPELGRFDFSKYDALVDCFSVESLQVLGVLHYNPSWRPVLWSTAPIVEDYLRYGRAVVRHFKPFVHDWEIWNEPDHATYWQPQDNLLAYSHLLKSVYPALKEEDSTCRILMGGLTGDLSTNLEHLYKQAGGASFDIVNIHPFVSPLNQNPLGDLRRFIDDTRRIMRKHADGEKPVWITEIGCPGIPDSSSSRVWWLGKCPTEVEQAEWVKTIYTEIIEWKGIEKIFWAFFRDTSDHFKDGVDCFGLVRPDFSPKPAFKAYQAVTQAFFRR